MRFQFSKAHRFGLIVIVLDRALLCLFSHRSSFKIGLLTPQNVSSISEKCDHIVKTIQVWEKLKWVAKFGTKRVKNKGTETKKIKMEPELRHQETFSS